MVIGICSKCGKKTTVRNHHYKGYSEENKDDVLPYCRSCDLKLHNNARKEGRCVLSHEEVNHLSKNSYQRRNASIIHLSAETLVPNIELREDISINKITDKISFTSYFRGNNEHCLKVIDEGKT